MKTIFPQRDNNRKKKKIFVVSSVVFGVLILIIVLSFWNANFFSPVVHSLAHPVFEGRVGFFGKLDALAEFVHSKNALIEENNNLKNKLTLMQATETERDFYKKENAEIAKLVGRTEVSNQFFFARLLSKPGFSPYDTVIVDAGKADGVKVGAQVLADADSVLGKISEVYAHTSLVTLYSSAQIETTVLIGAKSIQAVAIGKGGGNFELKLPRNIEVSEGDSVILAGVKPAKIVGTIQYIHSSPADSFEQILFKGAVDVSDLSYILIEK